MSSSDDRPPFAGDDGAPPSPPSGSPQLTAPEPASAPLASAPLARPPLAPAPLEPGQLAASGLGSGLLAKQPTPGPDEMVSVARVCPQCGGEYDTTDRFCPKDGTPLRPKAGGDPLIGRVVADRYLILALLGEGGMGRVYLAEHVKMNRQCAIKVMNPSLIHDDDSHQRFAREASSAASILHPNVAAVFDYGEADKIVYLVMEYVDGESISAIVAREGALDPRRAIDIARQVADGLHAAHELGIVHRDLKPDNIIVTRNKSGKEIPKVVDFGIAKAVTDSREDGLTQSGLVIGTPEYMSPEQLLGDPVDARADIYSLGCILYQMLTGRPAFAAESREQMIRRRLHEPPPHIRDLLPDLPRRLDTTIVHMLARSPKDRTASAADARDALDPALVLGGWDPANTTVPSAVASIGPYRNDPSLQPTIPMPKVRTSPRRVAVGAAIGVVALAGSLSLMRWIDLSGAPASGAPSPAIAPAGVAAATDSALRDPAVLPIDTAANLPAAPTKAAAKPVVKPAARDTARKAKPSPAPPAETQSAPNTAIVPPSEFDAPINRLVSAIGSRDTAAVRQEFRASDWSEVQQRFYGDIFAHATSVRVAWDPEKVSQRDDAHAERKVTLVITYGHLGDKAVAKARYIARYEQTNGRWDLQQLEWAPR